MTNQEAIAQLREINREAHIYSEAVDMAIKALEENYSLKQRCFVLSKGLLCHFCKWECNHRGD